MAQQKLITIIDDLFFTVKIQEAAKQNGLQPLFVKTDEEAMQQAGSDTALLILDLNNNGIDTLSAVRKLKSDPRTSGIFLLGYLSHVQVDLKKDAQEAGCDQVVPRSQLSQSLPTMLQKFTA